MNATYTMQAIPPYCKEIKERVRVLEWRGNRVLVESLEKPNYLIETDLGSISLDIPPETHEDN